VVDLDLTKSHRSSRKQVRLRSVCHDPLSFVLSDIAHEVEVERGLEGFEIWHVLQALLYLFEAGEVLVEGEDKAGGRDGQSVRG
jgi:hypothetical protein